MWRAVFPLVAMRRNLFLCTMVLCGTCLTLAFGACFVGGVLPSQQLVFATRHSERITQGIAIVDVERGLNLPLLDDLHSDFVISSHGQLTLLGDGSSIVAIDVYSGNRQLLAQNGEYDVGWLEGAWSPDGSALA